MEDLGNNLVQSDLSRRCSEKRGYGFYFIIPVTSFFL